MSRRAIIAATPAKATRTGTPCSPARQHPVNARRGEYRPAAQDLCDFDAVALRRMIAAGDASPVAVLESCIERIGATNPAVNAVVTTCFERARLEAVAAERAVDRGGLAPLHGLPVLIKDLAETAGLRTTYGSRCFATYVPDEDAIIVERLRKAGAIIIGKTNTPEFGAGANTTNLVFGATRNPFNPALTSGGSSGGSAAALSCGMAPLATGSDLGGSLRIPASFCSIVGMRPSPGVVPSRSNVLAYSPLWTDGPMARTVPDLHLLLTVIAGHDPRDPLSMPGQDHLKPRLDPEDLSQLRAGFSTDLGVAAVDHRIAALFGNRRARLGGHFGSAHDLDIDLSEATGIFRVLRAESLHAAFSDLVAQKGKLVGDNIRVNLDEANRYSLADVARAGAGHTRLFRRFQRLFDDIDVLICPATAVTPFPVEENHPTDINGVPLDGYFAWCAITWALSLTGCPVVTIPCGTDHVGMPFGIQIVTGRDQDHLALGIALALETVMNTDGIGRVTPTRPGLEGSAGDR